MLKAGLNPNINCHHFRNNFGRRALISGMSIYQLSVILGHSSVEIQRQVIIQLCIYLCEQYGISKNEIYGHRELGESNCPEDNYPLQIIKDSILNGNINKEECFDMKNIVIYSGDGDLPAAQLLSYKLSTAMISRASYEGNQIKAEHIFVIGGTWTPDNTDAVLLSSSGRIETMNAVMDFIKSL